MKDHDIVKMSALIKENTHQSNWKSSYLLYCLIPTDNPKQ